MSAAVVIVLVALGDGDDPSTRAMTRTTQQVLGEQSVILVREVPAMPDDKVAGELATSAHASAVVELEWSPDRRKAHLRVRTDGGTWTERDVDFQPADPPTERGRLLAFAVATMVPPSAEPEPTPVAAPPKGHTAPPKPPIAPPPAPFFGWLGLAVERASDGALERRSYGVVLRAAYVPRVFGFGASVGARSATIDTAAATSTSVRAAAGPLVSVRLARYAALSASFEAGAQHVTLSRPAVGSEAASHDGRWLPSLSIGLDAALGPEIASAVLSVSVEQMLGSTDVFVDGAHIGALPRTRALLGVGLRVRF